MIFMVLAGEHVHIDVCQNRPLIDNGSNVVQPPEQKTSPDKAMFFYTPAGL